MTVHKPIDYDQLDKLLYMQCTAREIAAFFNMSTSNLTRRLLDEKGINFAEYSEEKRALGNISLRRTQWRLAEQGNIPMLIWLAKNILGQRDRFPDEMPTQSFQQIDMSPQTIERVMQAARGLTEIVIEKIPEPA